MGFKNDVELFVDNLWVSCEEEFKTKFGKLAGINSVKKTIIV